MKNLFINYYVDKDEDRNKELVECYRKNVSGDQIDKVYLIVDSKTDLGGIYAVESGAAKVKTIKLERRPTFLDFYSYINIYSGDDDINIIANSDIYFDETLDIVDKLDMTMKCFALSRWDVLANGATQLHMHRDSQDVWIFKGKITKYINGWFGLGLRGVDNRILHEIREAGYTVINPSKLIKTYHLHNSGTRNYSITDESDLIPPPYDFAEPSGTEGLFPHKRILHIALNDFGKPQMGLRRCLESLGKCLEFDWIHEQGMVGVHEMKKKIVQTAKEYNADFTFIQTQNPEIVDADMMAQMPGFKMNWTGDVRFPIPRWYFEVGSSENTVTCFSNTDDMYALREEGRCAEFLQIGVDEELFKNHGGKLDGIPDIVFMGNHYEDKFPMTRFRFDMVNVLLARYQNQFGLYGVGWDNMPAHSLVGQEALESSHYRSCKIAINCSHFDYGKYSSDRIFRIMASGAFCLAFKHGEIEEDFEIGKHLDVWSTYDELLEKIDYYLKNHKERTKIAREGCREVLKNHTWLARANDIKELTKDVIDWDKDKDLKDELRKQEELVGIGL
jgi:spore maturation protein CgeB